MTRVSALALSAADFNTHSLHAADRIWPQKNCYVDLWIALLHAQNLDPLAMLPMVFALDFEGDQWTFFKPPLGDLRLLYGIDVQELTLWQSLLSHALEHLGAGKLLSVEVDSWWLPDTAGTDYRSAHAKTTIVVNDIDVEARRLGYFHNDGYHLLDGEDFAQLFCLDGALPVLPPYAELIRIDRAFRRDAVELRDVSRGLLAEHLTWRPKDNPVERFRHRFAADLPGLQAAGMDHYHKWAFAGVRQLGAAAELAAAYLEWLWSDEAPESAVQAFGQVAGSTKALMLKTARAVNSRRPFDADQMIGEMANAWSVAIRSTEAKLASRI